MITEPTSARPTSTLWWRLARLLGLVMLVVTGAIHLDLYVTGYRSIPTIGPLFLLQILSSFVIAAAVLVLALRVVAVAGAGFLLSTLIGYLVSLKYGLFGFREVHTTAGTVAGMVEIVGFAALAAFALRPVPRARPANESVLHSIVERRFFLLTLRWVAGVLTLQAALSLGLLVANSDATTSNTGGAIATLKTTTIHGVTVLTNKHGLTLYWFAPDSATTSRCYGSCALYWPPVLGTASPASGVAGSFGTLRRSNGTTQVTYNGHPLYTYVGDSAAGQAHGNHIDLNGGFWYEMKVSK